MAYFFIIDFDKTKQHINNPFFLAQLADIYRIDNQRIIDKVAEWKEINTVPDKPRCWGACGSALGANVMRITVRSLTFDSAQAHTDMFSWFHAKFTMLFKQLKLSFNFDLLRIEEGPIPQQLILGKGYSLTPTSFASGVTSGKTDEKAQVSIGSSTTSTTTVVKGEEKTSFVSSDSQYHMPGLIVTFAPSCTDHVDQSELMTIAQRMIKSLNDDPTRMHFQYRKLDKLVGATKDTVPCYLCDIYPQAFALSFPREQDVEYFSLNEFEKMCACRLEKLDMNYKVVRVSNNTQNCFQQHPPTTKYERWLKMMNVPDESIPDDIKCNLTLQIMDQPVQVALDTFVDAEVLKYHLLINPVNPYDRTPMTHTEVKCDATKQASIFAFMDKKVDTYANSAFRLQRDDKYQEAINKYLLVLPYHEEHARRLSQKCMKLLNNIACAYRDLSQYEDAIHYFKKLIRHDRQCDISANSIAQHYEKLVFCLEMTDLAEGVTNNVVRRHRETALQLYKKDPITNIKAIARIEKWLASKGSECKVQTTVVTPSIASATLTVPAETKISDYRYHIFTTLSSQPEKLRQNDETWQKTYDRNENIMDWLLFNLKGCPKIHRPIMMAKFRQEQPYLDKLPTRLTEVLTM